MHRSKVKCSDVHPLKVVGSFSEPHSCSRPRTIIEFRNWHEYVNYCEVQMQLPSNKAAQRYEDVAKTVKLARTGDPESAQKLTKYRKMMFDKVSEHLKEIELVPDVSCGSLIIPEYLAELPACFRRFAEVEDGQSVKIVFSPEVHVDSSEDALFIRGAAMLALVDALEASGRRVELWMGFDTTTSKGHYESQICIKAQGEFANATDLVFPACDTRFLSQLEYSILRSEWNTSVSEGSVGHNSGMSLQGDIVVDGNYQSGSMWSDVERCEAWILSLLTNLGVEVSK